MRTWARLFVGQRPLAETAYGLRRTLQRFAHSLASAEICSHLGVSSWNFMAFWFTAYDLYETNAYKNAHSVPGGKRRGLTQTPARPDGGYLKDISTRTFTADLILSLVSREKGSCCLSWGMQKPPHSGAICQFRKESGQTLVRS